MQSLKNKVRKLLASKNKKNILDIIALSHLDPMVTMYLPWTSSSLRPSALVKILNDIIVNKKKNIIEFGSGISTIYIASLIRNIDIDNKIIFYSVDHNENWINILKNILSKLNLSGNVKFVCASLEGTNLALENTDWYSEKILNKQKFKGDFDLILIDGPLAYTKELELSRYPAIPYLHNNRLISNNVSIYFDDIDRAGEEKIVKILEEKYGYKFIRNYLEGSIAISFNGTAFNI
ncbi:MAG: hypothetical protein D3919_10485 [Candidatus Electrothrix sp. AW5]|nr:hypothetical protein [Candidatus Electrothrix gigas]